MNGSALRGLLSVLCENVKDVTHRGEAPCTVHREQKNRLKKRSVSIFQRLRRSFTIHDSLFFILLFLSL